MFKFLYCLFDLFFESLDLLGLELILNAFLIDLLLLLEDLLINGFLVLLPLVSQVLQLLLNLGDLVLEHTQILTRQL